MGDKSICPVLANILDDEDDNLLVRHECAEALGAISDPTYNDILLKHSTHKSPEVAETCQIALELIEWRNKEENIEKSLYLSVDPAPPFANNISIEELKNILIDQSLSLFQRYRAMFSLRNMNNDKASLALLEGFNDDSSALFRHEIAYILGQMQRQVTIDGLAKVLENKIEHKMVRHEAAEALGAIGGKKVEKLLANYTSNDDEVVTQSCEVALDNIEYWQEIDTTNN
jgi:deoxyhypusine monooxygenase